MFGGVQFAGSAFAGVVVPRKAWVGQSPGLVLVPPPRWTIPSSNVVVSPAVATPPVVWVPNANGRLLPGQRVTRGFTDLFPASGSPASPVVAWVPSSPIPVTNLGPRGGLPTSQTPTPPSTVATPTVWTPGGLPPLVTPARATGSGNQFPFTTPINPQPPVWVPASSTSAPPPLALFTLLFRTQNQPPTSGILAAPAAWVPTATSPALQTALRLNLQQPASAPTWGLPQPPGPQPGGGQGGTGQLGGGAGPATRRGTRLRQPHTTEPDTRIQDDEIALIIAMASNHLLN